MKAIDGFYKASVFYTLANGINRASAFVYIPFLLQILSISDFGNFALIQSLSQLLIPIFLISSTSAVIRESKNGLDKSHKVYQTFSTKILVMNALGCFILIWSDSPNMYFFSVMLALAGGIHELNLAWFKVNDSFLKFILQVIFRIVPLLILFMLAHDGMDLYDILKYQYFITLTSGLSFQIIELKLKYIFRYPLYKSIVSYTVFIIPHGMGIWALSSSDRFIVKYLTNDTLLGYYSLGYSIAMLLSFLNSGLSSTIPQIVAKEYEKIDIKAFGTKIIKTYSIATIALFLAICLFLAIDDSIFNLLKYHNKEVYLVFLFAFLGIYMLGHYYFFSFFLIYFKKTATLAKISLLAASINVLMTTMLVLTISIVGAAISSFFSYITYLALVYNAANKLEPHLSKLRFTLISYSIFTIMSILIIFALFFIVKFYN